MKINRINNLQLNGNKICHRQNFPQVKEYTDTPQKEINTLAIKYQNREFQTLLPGVGFINFCGYKIFILDGGYHSSDMYNFAKTVIKPENETFLHKVKTIKPDGGVKDMKSLKESIKALRESGENLVNQYVAIPALATSGLLNIQDQMKRVTGDDIELKPDNIKTYKPQILKFLKEIYENPEKYSEYIGYLDQSKQNIHEVYGVIEEINKLIKAKARVFVPGGHPFDQSLKYLAKQREIKPELYHYISSGVDVDGKIKALKKEIKDKNWYDFNLLTLSEANIITIRDKSWGNDYIFAGYDTCITDSARGVYNLTPVRDGNTLLGYSFINNDKVEYPYESFPTNEKVANIAKYVGFPISKFLASSEEIKEFNRLKGSPSLIPDKLYPVKEVFTKDEIKAQKIEYCGDYVDRTGELFFRKNKNDLIVFPNCDCEGSGKPSVKSMWGTCFAVFNAIERDIYYQNLKNNINKTYQGRENKPHIEKVKELLAQARQFRVKEDIGNAERIYSEAIDVIKSANAPLTSKSEIAPLTELGDLFKSLGDYSKSLGCYNYAINVVCNYLKSNNFVLAKLIDADIKYSELYQYNYDVKKYNSMGFWERLFSERPRLSFELTQRLREEMYAAQYIEILKNLYTKVGDCCKFQGEQYSADCCYKAANELAKGSIIGDKIIQRRADRNHYIGDLV